MNERMNAIIMNYGGRGTKRDARTQRDTDLRTVTYTQRDRDRQMNMNKESDEMLRQEG